MATSTLSRADSARSEKEILTQVAALADDFASRAAEHDRDASFPFENFDALHAAGLLMLTVPREHGGLGFGIATYARVVARIAEGDPSTALVLKMHYQTMWGAGRARTWDAALYARVCREGLERPTLLNGARVEPELGTPARGGLPASTAERLPDGSWRINAHKIYTTGSPLLRYAIVWARTLEEPIRVGGFLVPMDAPGVTVVPTWDHLGFRATGSHDLIVDGTEIPPENALGLKVLEEESAGEWGGTLVATAALYNGILRAARNWLVGYLQERTPSNLGAPLSSLPRMQVAVGEIEALLFSNERLIEGVLGDLEAGVPLAPTAGGLAKHVITENAVRGVRIGLELLGNQGLTRSHPLERHYRDVLCGPVHTPQADHILSAAGKAAFAAQPR